jgi:predicted aspartyl protease
MFWLPHILRPVFAPAVAFCGLVGMPMPGVVAHASPDSIAEPAPVQLPIQIRSGHVYIDVEINGKGPFHFLFDTGASNVLTPAAAKRLDLLVRGNVEATGTGGAQAGGSARVDSVRLGGLTLSNQTFYVLDLPPGTSDGVPVDGLIGFEWLDRFPARLDYSSGTLTLYPGKDDHYVGSAKPAQLYFKGRTPQINGKVDGIAGRFSIDTGSSGSLTLSAPFVADHDLATRYHARTRLMSARGIGGPVYALLARAELLDLGTATAKRPVTFLSQQIAGTSVRKDIAGNIGFGVLRQFTIFFDYPRKQVYFEPNEQWGQPDLADRSGLRLERGDKAFAIAFVAENSPAATAGLKSGDRIVAVDSVPSDTLTLEDARTLLKGPVGTRILMTSDRGNAPIVVVLKDL